MDISIIIVSYNVRDFLRGALQSVQRALKAGGVTGEIFVVDNDSSDDSAGMVRAEFPDVHLDALKENVGFGRANNIALRKTTGDYLLILNPDTILGEDTLHYMLEFMKRTPHAGLAGCKLLNGDGSFQLSCRRGFPTPWASFTKLFGLASFFPRSPLFAQYNLTYRPVDATYEVDALGGAFMLLSRDAYEKTRGFDEDYFMYGEDLDLCYRAKQAGFAIYYVHGTATIHFKGESTKRSALNEVRVFYEAMHIFVKKNYGSSALFSFMLRTGIFLRTIFAVIKKQHKAIFLFILDALMSAAGVLLISKILLGRFLGLPSRDYPYAVLIPALLLPVIFACYGVYSPHNKRRSKQLWLGIGTALLVLSSLTFFFKEFASSRPLVLGYTAIMIGLLMGSRIIIRILGRFQFGGDGSASPSLARTIVVGTSSEAQRIAGVLKRTELIKRYQIIGFVDHSLLRLGVELLPGLPVLGDIKMLSKVIREWKISQVIFADESLRNTEILLAMQRVADENISGPVNFNLVPTASDILLGKHKIELLVPEPSSMDALALIPIEYNIQRMTNRILKRLTDIVLVGLSLPLLKASDIVFPSTNKKNLIEELFAVWRGTKSLVGSFLSGSRSPIPKPGVTSLAAITFLDPNSPRNEDLEQVELYYAKNHTLGMDLEILLRTMMLRRRSAAAHIRPLQ